MEAFHRGAQRSMYKYILRIATALRFLLRKNKDAY